MASDPWHPTNVPLPVGYAFPVGVVIPPPEDPPVATATAEEGDGDELTALCYKLRDIFQRRGYSATSIARKLVKFERGRVEHDEDLWGLDYLREMASETDDLACYAAQWWMHGGPQAATVVELRAAVRRVEVLLDRLKLECNHWEPEPAGVSLMAVATDLDEEEYPQ